MSLRCSYIYQFVLILQLSITIIIFQNSDRGIETNKTKQKDPLTLVQSSMNVNVWFVLTYLIMNWHCESLGINGYVTQKHQFVCYDNHPTQLMLWIKS